MEMSFAEALAAGVVGTRVRLLAGRIIIRGCCPSGCAGASLAAAWLVVALFFETWDVDYEYSWGFKELLGLRTVPTLLEAAGAAQRAGAFGFRGG